MAASRPFVAIAGKFESRQARRWRGRVALAVVALAMAGAFGGTGCSSSPAGPCDSSRCLAGNQCIDDGSGSVQCRLVCTSQSDCPTNYHCTPAPTGNVDFCAADLTAYPAGPGLWGASCNPSGGIATNPDCDSSQGFGCYAQSPTDASAYCTLYGCTADADCRGGWWCATVNQGPNASSASRTIGMTETVCQPRTYCAPCATDVDCWSPSGPAAKCIQDANGQSYCTLQCTSDSNCHLEASCEAVDQGGAAVVAKLSTSPATTVAGGASNDIGVGNPVDLPRHISAGTINVAGRAYPGTGEALTLQIRRNKTAIDGAEVRFDSTQLSLHDIAIPGLAGVALVPGDRLDCLMTYTRGVAPTHPPVPIPTDGLPGSALNVTVDATLDGVQSGLCVPRAGVCVGDGGLCAPCRSDGDCSPGICVPATNSTEHFCSVASSARCTSTSSPDICPATDEAGGPVSCTMSAQGALPANQCVGLVTDGYDAETGTVAYAAGCYTVNR
jgi:hypothetical protein